MLHRPRAATLGRMTESARQLPLIAAVLVAGLFVYGLFAALAITLG
jgi:hypothetical protein